MQMMIMWVQNKKNEKPIQSRVNIILKTSDKEITCFKEGLDIKEGNY